MNWEIIDDMGTIHSGTQEEMDHAFDVMSNSDEYSAEEIQNWGDQWDGDLKLVQIHKITK